MISDALSDGNKGVSVSLPEVVRSTLLQVTGGSQIAYDPILLFVWPDPLRPVISLAQVHQMNDLGGGSP